jgi:hypothetical protein
MKNREGRSFVVYLSVGRNFLVISSSDLKKLNQLLTISTKLKGKNQSNALPQVIISLHHWYVVNSVKVKFSGKGYKLVKYTSQIMLQLNTSHLQ